MFEVEIKVNGTVVSVQNTEPLYSGSADIYNCRFAFDASWDGFSRSAVFRVGSKVVTAVLGEEGVCTLPWELLTRANIGLEIEVGVYGVSAAAEVLTSVWDSIGTVRDGSEIGNDAREPGAGVYDQVMASVKRIDEKVQDYSGGILAITQRAESAAKSAQKSSVEARETVDSMAAAADRAETAMAAAQDALSGVQNAIKNIPAGSTPIVNDLTTGGTKAALSAEMGKVLGQRTNPNLLHNWYFGTPVNQRGQLVYTRTSTSAPRTCTIDRWNYRNGAGSCSVVVGGILLESTGSTYDFYLEQFVDPIVPGEKVTVSILTDDIEGRVSVCFVYDGGGTSNSKDLVNGLTTMSYTTDRSISRVLFMVRVGSKAKLRAVKLEYGSAQTLAHQDKEGNWVLNEIPDYAEELRKCKRYFQVINGGGRSNVHLLDVWGTGNTAVGTLPLSVPMRVTPAVTISGLSPKVWLTKRDGDTVAMAQASVSSIAVSADTADVYDIDRLRLEVTAAVESDAGFVFEENKRHEVTSVLTGNIGASSKIFLDANL